MKYYPRLRDANIARQAELLDGKPALGVAFRGLELNGELNELLDAMAADAVEASPHSFQAVLDELADTYICLDLLAEEMGGIIVLYNRNALTSPVDAREAVGALSNATKKYIREQLGLPGSRVTRNDLEYLFTRAATSLYQIAVNLDISLPKAIEAKFNNWSEKQGLETRMGFDPSNAPTSSVEEVLNSLLGNDKDEDDEDEDTAIDSSGEVYDALERMVALLRERGHAEQADALAATFSRATDSLGDNWRVLAQVMLVGDQNCSEFDAEEDEYKKTIADLTKKAVKSHIEVYKTLTDLGVSDDIMNKLSQRMAMWALTQRLKDEQTNGKGVIADILKTVA